jgi:hypothetical protein
MRYGLLEEPMVVAPPFVEPTGRGRRELALVAAAAALHLGLGVFLAAIVSVDVDEAYSLSTSALPLVDTLRRALTFELQPPLYFLLLNLWRAVDPGVFWARLLSVACTTGVVVLAPGAIRRFAPAVRAPIVALVLALNPVLVWAAFTTRGYALIALLSTALLALGHRAFLAGAPRPRAVAAYALVALAALHTQYYLGFLLAGFGAALLVTGRWRALGAYALAMLGVAALTAPLLAHTAEQVLAHAAVGAKPGLLDGLVAAARQAENLVLPMHLVTFGRAVRWGARVLFWGETALALLLALRTRAPLAAPHALAAVVAVMVAGYGLAHVAAGHDAVAMRHTIGLLVPALALALALLAAPPAPLGRRAVALAATVALVMSANALWRDYHDLDSNPAHKAAVAWLEANPRYRADQPILVFPTDSALALAHHVHNPERLVGLPREASLTTYAPAAFAVTSETELDARVRPALSPTGEAWLVRYSETQLFGVDLGVPLLTRYLETTFETQELARFEDCEVLFLRAREAR